MSPTIGRVIATSLEMSDADIFRGLEGEVRPESHGCLLDVYCTRAIFMTSEVLIQPFFFIGILSEYFGRIGHIFQSCDTNTSPLMRLKADSW